jgi:tRNA modification GTPase
MVLFVLDGTSELTEEDRRVLDGIQGKPAIAVINKGDLPRKLGATGYPENSVIVSCRTGEGLNELRRSIARLVLTGAVAAPREHAWAINQRHKTALEKAKENLGRVVSSIESGLSPEFAAVDLRAALDQLGIVIGATCTEEILERIFEDFCIGK